jgi:hypothetical protein
MSHPYPECSDCVAQPWCKYFNGVIEKMNTERSWCNPRFRMDKALELSRIPPSYKFADLYRFKVDDDNSKVFNERIRPAVVEKERTS